MTRMFFAPAILFFVSGCFIDFGPLNSGDPEVETSTSDATSVGLMTTTDEPTPNTTGMDDRGETGQEGSGGGGFSGTGDDSTTIYEGGGGTTAGEEEACFNECDEPLLPYMVAQDLNRDCTGPNGMFSVYQCEDPPPSVSRIELAEVLFEHLYYELELICGGVNFEDPRAFKKLKEPLYNGLTPGGWEFAFLTPFWCTEPKLFPRINGWFCSERVVCLDEWENDILPLILEIKPNP